MSHLWQTYRRISRLKNFQFGVIQYLSCHHTILGRLKHPPITSSLSFLQRTLNILISELTIPERASGGGGIKNKQKSSQRREVTSKVHCPRRKRLFFCLVSDIPSSLSAMENVLFFAHSRSELKTERKKTKQNKTKKRKIELSNQHGWDI